jgi:hypothetical protein
MVSRFKTVSYALVCVVSLALMLNFLSYSASYNSRSKIVELQSRINMLEISRTLRKPPINISGGLSTTTAAAVTTVRPLVHNNYLSKYPHMLDCKNEYKKLASSEINRKSDSYDYKSMASNETQSLPIIRAILVYFPIASVDHFQPEFRWLYRSWIEMQKYEPKKWRTDLIVFVDRNVQFNKSDFFLHQLNCSFSSRRVNAKAKPMCILVEYRAVRDRNIVVGGAMNVKEQDKLFEFFFNDVNVYEISSGDNELFLKYLKANLNSYGYLDSILMAFEGYEYFKSAGYDYLIR